MSKMMRLKYPATCWQDALPCGNGHIGALVYGNIKHELMVVNHDRMYLHKYKRPQFSSVSHHLPKAREMMLAGQCKEGFDYLMDRLGESFENAATTNPYQPFCDIHIKTDTKHAFYNYQRTLDLETGEATVTWLEEGKTLKRQTFVSRHNNTIILRLSGERYPTINLGITPSGLLGATGMGSGLDVMGDGITHPWSSKVQGNKIIYAASREDGVSIGAVLKVVTDGKLSRKRHEEADIDTIQVDDASKCLVFIKLYYDREEQEAVAELMSKIEGYRHNYALLLAEHVSIHGELYNRATLSLGNDIKSDKSIEEQMLDSYSGHVSPELVEKMANYGRYLLIASTAPGAMPPNLQGIWNGDYAPAWSSDYHNDENIQMNYWAALPGNLAELTLPMFDYYDSLIDDFRENARKLYGCRGILIPICNTTHGLIYEPCVWNAWTGGTGWIAQHYFDYWLYTQDDDFLRERALPFMLEAALFYIDFFILDEEGRLLSVPSMSPENTPKNRPDDLVTVNATMDFAIAKELMSNIILAYEHLGIEDAMLDEIKDLLDKIPAYQINEDGAVKEWMYDGLEDNYHHRHQSHIYPLFPGIEVTEEKDKETFDAMRVAVEKRLVVGLSSQTGWSLAHMANIYARLGEGDRALECIELLIRSCTGSNLLTYHNDWRSQGISMYWGHGSRPPFQIDANLGVTAAVTEMLLFSDVDMIKVLPALPSKWEKGHIKHVRCRGNRMIDILWDTGMNQVNIRCTTSKPNSFVMKVPREIRHIGFDEGDITIAESSYGKSYVTINPRTDVFDLSITM